MITEKLFNTLFPTKGLNPQKYNLVAGRKRLIAAMNDILPRYGINTHKRIAAFWGNCGIETDYFKTSEEYASGWAYDVSYNPVKAKSLGNTTKGDGPRYKGSGLTQTTGKYNFAAVQKSVGAKLGIDVVKNPEILRENIEIAVESACIFWRDNNLNYYADRSLFKNLSAIVNRGDKNKTPLHWEKRKALYEKCLSVVPRSFTIAGLPDSQTGDSWAEVLIPAETNSPESLSAPATTAVEQSSEIAASNGTSNQAPAENPPSEESKIKQAVEKYLNHAKTDSAKNIFQVISARIGLAITTLFASGITGKIFLIIILLVIIGIVVYAFIKYRTRFFAWTKAIFDSLFNQA